MELEAVFKKIDFVKRYQHICANHNDFGNSLISNDKKMYIDILRSFDDSVIYLNKDKMFKTQFELEGSSLDLGLTLSRGVVEAQLFYIKNGEWLIYNRFDFLAGELDPSYDRDTYNIPSFTSVSELKAILKDIFFIYEDIKKEAVLNLTMF